MQLTQEQIAHYQHWERNSSSELPGRYSMGFEGAPVFALRDEDTPVVTGRVGCKDRDGHTVFRFSDESPCTVETLGGVSAADINRLFAVFDGQTSFRSACEAVFPGVPPERFRALCQSLLGHGLSVAAAVESLERGIRRVEIVRFPMQSPYLVLREYWSNCRDVRAAVPRLFDSLQTVAEFKQALADLHILATMGSGLDTYYGGAGSVATIPGGYRSHPVRTGLSEGKARFIDYYLQQLGLPRFRREERLVFSDAGTLLGCVAGEGRVFRHPPADNNYLEMILGETRFALLEVVRLMEEGRSSALLAALSRFHKLFLHAHPFYNINNSVAMNIVNYCLECAGFGVIPHLVLDFIALRTEFSDYARVFGKAVEDYAFATPPAGNEAVMARIASYHARLQGEE